MFPRPGRLCPRGRSQPRTKGAEPLTGYEWAFVTRIGAESRLNYYTFWANFLYSYCE